MTTLSSEPVKLNAERMQHITTLIQDLLRSIIKEVCAGTGAPAAQLGIDFKFAVPPENVEKFKEFFPLFDAQLKKAAELVDNTHVDKVVNNGPIDNGGNGGVRADGGAEAVKPEEQPVQKDMHLFP